MDLLVTLLISLLNVFPNSPFQAMINLIDKIDILGYLNWFIPFDIAFMMLQIWISSMVAYYTAVTIGKIAFRKSPL